MRSQQSSALVFGTKFRQAKQADFTAMLRSRLPKLDHLMVVSGNFDVGKRVLDFFVSQLPTASVTQGHVFSGGLPTSSWVEGVTSF
jgi:hypothetical protein